MRGSQERTRDRWRIVEFAQFPGGGWTWRLFRDCNGVPLDFRSEKEAVDALHVLRENRVPGRFRVHHGAFSMAAVKEQGHRLRPPKDLYLRYVAAHMKRAA